MKLIKNSNNNSHFPTISVNLWLWLLLMGFSAKSMAQLYVSENTVLSIKENTVFYTADEILETTFTGAEKETGQKKQKAAAKKQKKSNKPLQPPIVKKDTESEKKGVLSFTSKQKPPSALFYAGKTTKAALVQNISFVTKSISPKKSYKNTIHTFLPNADDQQIKTSFAGIIPKHQIHLEEQITRPPPFFQNLT